MTEKTDIEALRDKLELALKDLTERLTDCHRLNFCMDELSAFTAFSSTVIDQLEEERHKREAAEAELAALRGEQEPVSDIIRDANRYRFLRDEDSWGEDSDSWDFETRAGLISSQNLMGGLSPEMFDAAVDARMAASDIPFLNPVSELFTRQPKPVVVLPDEPTARMQAAGAAAIRFETTPINKLFTANAIWRAMKSAFESESAGIVVKDGE